MHERHTDKQLYFKEQVYTTEKYVIPFIRKAAPLEPGMTVLEIGCGEGGNLKPFLDLGCKVTGIDISRSKIESALKYYQDHPDVDRTIFVVKDESGCIMVTGSAKVGLVHHPPASSAKIYTATP